MDQISEYYQHSAWLVPLVTLVIGLMGSVHCASMCGGLVLVSAPTIKHQAFYHTGRLLSYSLIAIVIGLVGKTLQILQAPTMSLIFSIMLGGIFIWFGINTLRKSQVIKLSPPQFLMGLWNRFLPKNNQERSKSSSFMIGSLSIFLPCGFFYSVLIALGSLQAPQLTLISILTFWIGTLPGFYGLGVVAKKVFTPLEKQKPILISFLLIGLGLVTITHRFYQIYFLDSCCN